METKLGTWQERFGLTTCAASDIEKAIPAAALGVAVIYTATHEEQKIFLVIESRAGSLRSQCARRLQTAKLPLGSSLMISFRADILPDSSPESVHSACRQQVIFAAEIRRELRPSMR
jgi:hypothetical protein